MKHPDDDSELFDRLEAEMADDRSAGAEVVDLDKARAARETAPTTDPTDLEGEEAAGRVVVDRPTPAATGPGYLGRLAAAKRRDVIPVWLRSTTELRTATGWVARHYAHAVGYHALRARSTPCASRSSRPPGRPVRRRRDAVDGRPRGRGGPARGRAARGRGRVPAPVRAARQPGAAARHHRRPRPVHRPDHRARPVRAGARMGAGRLGEHGPDRPRCGRPQGGRPRRPPRRRTAQGHEAHLRHRPARAGSPRYPGDQPERRARAGTGSSSPLPSPATAPAGARRATCPSA